MSDKKEIILIPYWIQEVLARNQLALSACLDIEKIKPLLSLNDLVSFITLQDPKYFQLSTSIPNNISKLVSIWNSITSTNKELSNFCWTTLLPMSNDVSFHKDLVARLFEAETQSSRFKEPFVVYDLTPDTVGVVIYPGYFVQGVNNYDLHKSLIEELLEVLYRYSSFSDVAKTSTFKQYLDLLSSKR